MILYHLDRQNTLPTDKSKQLSFPIDTRNTLEANTLFNSLYPNGISKTGERYLNPFDIRLDTLESSKNTCANFRIYTIEYVFEMVRLLHFPHFPSRLTSLFACRCPEDVVHWYNILCKNSMDTSNATVKIIETSNKTFIGDSFWRDDLLTLKVDAARQSVFSPFAYHEWAKKYWNGVTSASPSIEVLCELPVTVIESIPYSSF
ncbi:MAG: DUF2441 domain-containing protein [Lachnospiraceae bacterium]|nr:DUF2441 domain-containing protein [Lachnospiraceae bacterium]MBP3477555.1 DUF2441 domain-containing protein [Lachnospiraceae bacterium]